MRGIGARLVFAAALAGAATGAWAEDLTPELLGRTIESVAFTCDGPVDARQIASLVDLHAGRALTRDDTGATIENLFATLDFSNVLVAAEPRADGGVAVTIHLWRSSAWRASPSTVRARCRARTCAAVLPSTSATPSTELR